MIPGAKDQALFLYGFEVTQFNNRIPFRNVALGPELIGVMNEGNYTCTEYMAEVVRAMTVADGGATIYTCTLDRTQAGNTDNRMHISTDGAYLDLLFLTGTVAANSIRTTSGFGPSDYTGATTYAGIATAGTILIPQFPMYEYHGPNDDFASDGVKNISAFGIKETLVFSQVDFFSGEWKWITDQDGSSQKTKWTAFMRYATRQKKLEFTPSLTESPTTFYQCTLETTPEDSNGMKFKFKQMTAQGLWRFFKTGTLKFRVSQE